MYLCFNFVIVTGNLRDLRGTDFIFHFSLMWQPYKSHEIMNEQLNYMYYNNINNILVAWLDR